MIAASSVIPDDPFSEVALMAKRVDLDAMIPRADFDIVDKRVTLDLFRDFPIRNLEVDNPVLRLLRKPDFQRETNHWSPDQIVTFLASFVDGEVIPSLILWKATGYIFVIDGGHRLSALRAWMEDDYGDGPISLQFYRGDISDEQKAIARRTRKLVEKYVGRYSTLRKQVDAALMSEDKTTQRAQVVFTRALALQWIPAESSAVAQTSFFKINSQGTPLDETETLLIKNRKKPVAIGARAILRAGTGHKYWSAFNDQSQKIIEERAGQFHNLLFDPEIESPLKTLELPLGGQVSPVNALSLLIEFLSIAGSRDKDGKSIDKYEDDETGDGTISVLKNSLQILKRITGNDGESLGLHPAVYFYNERGKYSRFLFLGMTALIQDRIRNNDSDFFKAFTNVRGQVEQFLIDNKSLIGLVLQNLAKNQRVPKMRDLFAYLVAQLKRQKPIKLEDAIAQLGLRGRILDVNAIQTSPTISDETKSMLFVRDAIKTALHCPICSGLLDPKKSVSYDHIKRVRNGGTGELDNTQLVHPYCNTSVKN